MASSAPSLSGVALRVRSETLHSMTPLTPTPMPRRCRAGVHTPQLETMASSQAMPFEMADAWSPISDMLSHLLFEEFIMLLCAIFPICLGFVASLQVLTGQQRSGLDAEHAGDLGELGASLHHDVEESTHTLQTNMTKVEQQITDLQRGHDQRFADLHKDLAGIVWELSKLRADMARWQALAQLGGRAGSRGAGGGAVDGGAAGGGTGGGGGESLV